MRAILLSVKPKYVRAILQGEKKFEYRKRLAKEAISYVYIYCTAPVKKVVARVYVEDFLSNTPVALWEETKAASGISHSEFQDYFCDCEITHAYKLGEVEEFKYSKDLSDFGVAASPQSFVYIDV